MNFTEILKDVPLETRILIEEFILKASDMDIEDLRRVLRFAIRLRNASTPEIRRKIILKWMGF